MQFSDIIGQDAVQSKLVDLIRQNRLSHALLFLAPEGSGSLSLARALAQYIVCEKVNGIGSTQTDAAPSLFGESPVETADQKASPEAMQDSCGVCPACIKAAKLIHPDIHFSFPVITSKPGEKPISADFITEWRTFLSENPYGNLYDWLQHIVAENKQGNISAQECNEIIHIMSLKSFESGYKILIMWMPEMLGKEGNKLLKLIEEPPPKTLFILVAENESAILPTIISRTQLVKIPALKASEIETALQLREGISKIQARQFAALADGNYLEALHLVQHANDNWEQLLREWMNSIVKTGPVAQLKWIEEISKIGREKQKQFLGYFLHIIELAIRMRYISLAPGDLERPDIQFAQKLNNICAEEQSEKIAEELNKAIYYIERNAHGKILFHSLTIKLNHLISNKSVILMH